MFIFCAPTFSAHVLLFHITVIDQRHIILVSVWFSFVHQHYVLCLYMLTFLDMLVADTECPWAYMFFFFSLTFSAYVSLFHFMAILEQVCENLNSIYSLHLESLQQIW
ncbi:hypothetical protein DM860_008508 [Cuscuta australis]|uniref:Uncharacterized protein n=1 Tax=Cuscuta australis TaxID=267555 RepID=A0A328D6Q5_9ASTE|nr:hypothetical protein DM860_008508 [Cuscuta australis]